MIPQPDIEWQEPSLFRTFQGESDANKVRPWIRLLVFAGAVGGCLLAWYFAKENSPEKHAPLSVMLALGVGIGGFIAFIVPKLRANSPYRVGFYERGVSRASKTDIRHWKYEDIDAWAVTVHEHQNQTLRVLNLHLKNGKLIAAGMADRIEVEAIAALFAKHNVKLSPKQAMKPESRD